MAKILVEYNDDTFCLDGGDDLNRIISATLLANYGHEMRTNNNRAELAVKFIKEQLFGQFAGSYVGRDVLIAQKKQAQEIQEIKATVDEAFMAEREKGMRLKQEAREAVKAERAAIAAAAIAG